MVSQLRNFDLNGVCNLTLYFLSELTTKGFQWQNMDGQVQHDAHELNRLLIDALEKSLKRTSGEALCRTLYEGSCVNQIKCLSCMGVSERSEPYYDINLQIIDCPDMFVSLRKHCAAELLTGDSAYQCDTCRTKRQALRSTVLRTLPQVLTFSCSRFRIDRSTNWTRVKVTSCSEFPLILDMTPFSEAGSMPGAHNASSVHDPIHSNPDVEADYVESLRSNQSTIWLKKVLRSTEGVAKELVEQYGETVRFADVDEEQYEAIARHLTPHMFSGSASGLLMYQLHAVVMHRGSAHSGHYFAYIRDNLAEGKWSLPEAEPLAFTPTPTVQAVAATKAEVQIEPVAAAKVAPEKLYVKESPSGTFLVDEASPLGLILKIITPSAPSARAAPPSNKPNKFNKNSAKEVAGPATFKVNYISTEIASRVRSNWGQKFSPKFGPLEAFLRAQSDLLRVSEKGEVEVITSKMKLVSTANYQRAQNLQKPAPAKPSAPPVSTSPSQDKLSDVDELLARSLQAELDIDRHSRETQTTTPTPAEPDWETAGVKRKEKKADHEGSSLPSANALNSAKEARVKSLAAEIFSHFYGNFFEFNDSQVTPIAAAHLERAFEGFDSAYLLVYRQLTVPANVSAFLAESRLRLVTDDRISGVVARPPNHFEKEVAAQNELLRQERHKYELSFSNVRINVCCPAHVTYQSPLLLPVSQSSSEESQATGSLPFLEVEIDSRKTVSDLKALFAEQYSAQSTTLGVSTISELQVSLLERFGEGYYVLETFPATAPISDLLNRRSSASYAAGPTVVLLWDGQSIGGERVLTGLEGYPKLLSVSLLVPPETTEGAHREKQVVQESKLYPALYLPNTLSLLEFAHKLCDLCSVPRLRAAISVLCVVNASTTGGNGLKLEKQFVSTVLYNKGIISGKALMGSAPGSATVVSSAAAAGMVLSSHCALGEFDGLTTVLVEDCESRGLQGNSLVDEFVLRKNSQWGVTVELDFTPAEEDQQEGERATTIQVRNFINLPFSTIFF